MVFPKRLVIICGPTASGKTRLALDMAKELQTEIISSDSRQCYRELNIGVAKPSAEELSEVNHYFINSHSIFDKVNASVYEDYALEKIRSIFKNSDTAIIAGGTGLYVGTLIKGLDEIPAVEPEIEEKLKKEYNLLGMDWLVQKIKEEDPDFYFKGEMKNPHRILRALGVKLATGKSILDYHKKSKAKRDFDIRKIWLEVPREELYERIDQRVDRMMDAGLLDEVKNLYEYRNLVPLQTVGYRELFDYLDKKNSLEEAIGLIKRNTRRYAKRQVTWFRKYFLHD